MKKNLVVLVLLTLFASGLQAQRFRGIRVESNAPVEVYLDGVRMCSPVHSCMITNLRRGAYLLEAFLVMPDRGRRLSKLVFKEEVFYSGTDIKDIFIQTDNAWEIPYPPGDVAPMDDHTFDQLLSQINQASFDSDKKRIIEMAVSNSLFYTRQVHRLAQTYSFDSEKLWLLKLMYPVIVDRERAFLLQDVFSFSSSKKEFVRFAEEFDRR